ncbi:hypothetical protein ABEF95_014954 [Exophiala dermatitidis]
MPEQASTMPDDHSTKVVATSEQTDSGNTLKTISNAEDTRLARDNKQAASTAPLETAAPENGTTTPPAMNATTPAEGPVYSIPKFDASTEKEIRAMMNRIRSIHNGKTVLTHEEVMDLAAFTGSLIQIMNAEYIAKDTIVRAIAYMRGESELSPRRALNQAKRDRRAARSSRNGTNGGQTLERKAMRGSEEISRANREEPNGNVKEKGAGKDTSGHSSTSPITIAVTSDTSHEDEGKGISNGTTSEKENTPPDGATRSTRERRSKGKKRPYWKGRRQASKANAAAHVQHDNGVVDAVNNGAMVTNKNGDVVAVKDDAGAPGKGTKQVNGNNAHAAKLAETKDNKAHESKLPDTNGKAVQQARVPKFDVAADEENGDDAVQAEH